MQCLEKLTSLGRNVHEETCARRLERSFKSYLRHTEIDAGYAGLRFLPVLTIVKANPGESTESIMKNVTTQLNFLAHEHRKHLTLKNPVTNEFGEVEIYRRRPPLLYGLLIAHHIVIVVTLDSSVPGAEIRNIAHFDMLDAEQSLWNGLAIAIVCNAAKRSIMPFIAEFDPDSDDDGDVYL